MTNLLKRLEAAILQHNPLLALEYLKPGLSVKALDKRFRNVSGNVGPLRMLYAWRDGTEFVNLVPGETFVAGISKVSFFPVDTFLFKDSEQAIAMMDTSSQAAQRHRILKEGVGRYFPIFTGTGAKFLFDLSPASGGRIIYFNDEAEKYYQLAYTGLDDFISDVAQANETNSRLNFLAKREKVPRWESGNQ